MRVFVTGVSRHIASAVIPELLSADHAVTGLARSDRAAAAVEALGAAARQCRPHHLWPTLTLISSDRRCLPSPTCLTR